MLTHSTISIDYLIANKQKQKQYYVFVENLSDLQNLNNFVVPMCCSENLSFQILIQRNVRFEYLGVNNNKERLNENGHQYVCFYYRYILSLTASLLTYH